MRRAIRTERTFRPSGHLHDPLDAPSPSGSAAAPLGALAVVPLFSSGRVLGAIQVERSSVRPFSDVEVVAAEIVADLLAGRLEAAPTARAL